MAQRPDGKPAATERVVFTRPAAERISKVVRTVEAGDRRSKGLSFGVQAEAPMPIKLGTFTGSWETGTYKTVTLSGSTNTASVFNWCNAVDASGLSSSVTQTVIFAKVRGTNSALELPLSQSQGIRMATFTGACALDSTKIVSFKRSAGTAMVFNELINLPSAGERSCVVGKEGTSWVLINWQWDVAPAATAATLTTAELRFDTLPAGVLATSSTVSFSVSVATCGTSTAT